MRRRERLKPFRDPLTDPTERDLRLTHICRMFDSEPDKRLFLSTQRAGDLCILTIAIRDMAIFEMTIPWERADPWKLLTLLDKHGGSVSDDKDTKPPFRQRGPAGTSGKDG